MFGVQTFDQVSLMSQVQNIPPEPVINLIKELAETGKLASTGVKKICLAGFGKKGTIEKKLTCVLLLKV